GNVGSRVTKKCESLGMKTYLNDPPLQRQTGNSKYLPIEKLFDCDFVTLHTPLTFEGEDKTFHLADDKFFKSLKKGCIFINASRGGVVDSSAFKTAIEESRLQATVLDVWEDEPNIDVELLEMVDIGTPHIAGYSLDGKIAGMIMIYKEACEYFELDVKFDIDSFLPVPAIPELKINTQSVSQQDALLGIVEKIYDIKADDVRLRRMLEESAKERCKYFDSLRRNYPVRREFQNTRIIVDSKNSSLARKLKGVGFLLL
ncbi:MAG: DUF3410 domain-containing protein, partial [Sedimentisphaerales bacterium]